MTIRIPEDRLRLGFTQIAERIGTSLRGDVPAFIGDPVSGNIFANEQSSEIYIHFSTVDPSGVTTISASGIPKDKLRYAQPILIKEMPSKQYRYVGIDVQADEIYSDGFTENSTQEPVYINQFRWGTLHPFSGLQVFVASAFYDDIYVADLITEAFDGTATDTSAGAITTPSTNNRTIAVLVQLDAENSTLEYKQSSEYSSFISPSQAFNNGLLPTVDTGRVRVGYVLLKYGAIALSYADLWQAPQFITTSSGSTPSSSSANVINKDALIPSGKDAFFAGELNITSGTLTIAGELYVL